MSTVDRVECFQSAKTVDQTSPALEEPCGCRRSGWMRQWRGLTWWLTAIGNRCEHFSVNVAKNACVCEICRCLHLHIYPCVCVYVCVHNMTTWSPEMRWRYACLCVWRHIFGSILGGLSSPKILFSHFPAQHICIQWPDLMSHSGK